MGIVQSVDYSNLIIDIASAQSDEAQCEIWYSTRINKAFFIVQTMFIGAKLAYRQPNSYEQFTSIAIF